MKYLTNIEPRVHMTLPSRKYLVSSEGFTIIELMIAMSVLAVLLTIASVVLLNLGGIYVKGTDQAAAQNAARNIVNDITNQLQLGFGQLTASPPGSPQPSIQGQPPAELPSNQGYVCIGTTRYVYLIGQQVSSSPGSAPNSANSPDQTLHALWRDSMSSPSNCSSPVQMQAVTPGISDDTSSGVELIPNNMRLIEFSVVPSASYGATGLVNITVGIAYGDNDLLCAKGTNNLGSSHSGSDCDSSNITNDPAGHIANLETGGSNIGCISGIGNQFCGVSILSVTVARRLASE